MTYRQIPQDELARILADHRRWRETEGQEGSRAYLGGAYLGGAYLRGADLGGADLGGAKIPIVPNLHRKILSVLDEGKGTLDMGSWHRCETTHCRAGWAITLAGEAGKELEKKVGPAAAGAFITLASCPFIDKVPNFMDSNDGALADIRACAMEEESIELSEQALQA